MEFILQLENSGMERSVGGVKGSKAGMNSAQKAVERARLFNPSLFKYYLTFTTVFFDSRLFKSKLPVETFPRFPSIIPMTCHIWRCFILPRVKFKIWGELLEGKIFR